MVDRLEEIYDKDFRMIKGLEKRVFDMEDREAPNKSKPPRESEVMAENIRIAEQ